MDILATMIAEGRMQVSYAPFEMALSWVGQARTTSDLYAEAQKINLKQRKRQLEVEIVEMKDEIERKQAELREINVSLKPC